MNYTQLVSAVQNTIEDDFPKADIDTMIRQAEERIYHNVQLPALRKTVDVNTVAGNALLDLPEDWLAMYSMHVTLPNSSEVRFLLNKDISYLQAAFPDPSVQGNPRFYAVFDDERIQLVPTPNSAMPVRMHYFYRPESIVTASTTWLGDNFETALLYGTLVEAAIFIKNAPERIAVYQQQFQDAMRALSQLGSGKNKQDTFRTPPTRYSVG